MSANIGAPSLNDHWSCRQTIDKGGDPGDVRYCKHGRIMYCFQRGGTRDRNGYGAMFSFWQELSPVFNPIRYRKAKRALQGGKP